MNIIPVLFRNTELQIIDLDGTPFTPMRPIVEGMGLDWKSQYQKLSDNKDRFSVVIITTETPAGRRESLCLPMRKVFGWLTTIHSNKVKPELRESIIAYQRKCDDILWEAWTKESRHRDMASTQHEKYWFTRYPHWRVIRDQVRKGTPYKEIALIVSKAVGSISRAVNSMIARGLMNPLEVARAQKGPARHSALKKLEDWGYNQLPLLPMT